MIPGMTTDGAAEALDRHVRQFFAGHSVGTAHYDLGDGSRGMVRDLRILAWPAACP